MDTEEEFFAIANELVSEEANKVLDRQMARVQEWRQDRLADGQTADLRDLIIQVASEPNHRGLILAVYAAAMWRLMEQDGAL